MAIGEDGTPTVYDNGPRSGAAAAGAVRAGPGTTLFRDSKPTGPKLGEVSWAFHLKTEDGQHKKYTFILVIEARTLHFHVQSIQVTFLTGPNPSPHKQGDF